MQIILKEYSESQERRYNLNHIESNDLPETIDCEVFNQNKEKFRQVRRNFSIKEND